MPHTLEHHPSPQQCIVWALLGLYLLVECVFYLVFRVKLVPRANELVEPPAFRDYGHDRCKLLMRIVERTLRAAEAAGANPQEAFQQTILDYFESIPQEEDDDDKNKKSQKRLDKQVSLGNDIEDNEQDDNDDDEEAATKQQQQQQQPSVLPSMFSYNRESTASLSGSSTDDATNSMGSINYYYEEDEESLATGFTSTWSIDGLGKDDMDALLAWAFFGRPKEHFQEWEHRELQKMYEQLQQRLGLVFAPGSGGRYRAKQVPFDPVSPLHRPLLVYGLVFFIQCIAAMVLRCNGFQRVTSKIGLTGWYRPATKNDEQAQQLLPLLFFHGIAPSGLCPYLPFVLCGLLNDGRAAFLLENRNISCQLGFRVLSEDETAQAVAEIVDPLLGKDRPVALVGHSFGSVPLTWLLHSKQFHNRIRQFVLLDPITILLSNPDVMTNFLYKMDMSKIRLLASSELFTEYSVRRGFAFYNSELWMDDLPESVQPIIALSENDEIVNVQSVRDYLDVCHADDPRNDNPVKLLFWEGVPHAACVTCPEKWRQIKQAMLRQEQQHAARTTVALPMAEPER